MTIDEARELLLIEKECVERNNENCILCDRNCEKCDLMQDSDKIIEMYNNVAEWLEELKAIKENNHDFFTQYKNDAYNKGRADAEKELREKELKHIHDILPPVHNCKLFDFEKFYRDEHDNQIREDIIKELNAKGYLFDTDEYGETVGRNDEFWIELMKRKNNE